MNQQKREQLLQDLDTKIARHIRRELALQGLLAHNADNKRMVTSRILELIDLSGVKLSYRETAALCFRVAELLFEPLTPRDPVAPEMHVIRRNEGIRLDEQARDWLLAELATGLARHISHRLGAEAPLPRNDDTYTQVKTHFTLLVSQSGVNLGPLQTHELYAKTLGALFEPPPPDALGPPVASSA